MRCIYFLLFLFISGCSPDESPPAPGIYYWRTDWQLGADAGAELRAGGIAAIYLRFFDVDYDFGRAAAAPRGLLQLPPAAAFPAGMSVTPVVFIVERVFRQNIDIDDLARRISRTVVGLAAGHPALEAATRWQIDCDWTPTSRDRYFAFLSALQALNPELTISVTIRLHQYRERVDNGIPPVPEGLLMCYNMEPVQQAKVKNAIYNEDLLSGYLKAPPYPIPLDAALPVFAWGAAFRDERFLGITPTPDRLNPIFLAVSSHQFLLRRDTTLGDVFVRAGDLVRYDGPGGQLNLERAAAMLGQRPDLRDLHFFDWQPGRLEAYDLPAILQKFRSE
jgi:hypothetical protein